MIWNRDKGYWCHILFFIILFYISSCYCIEVEEITSIQSLDSGSINIINSPEKYLIIKQYLIPDKEFYSINDSIRVAVEIRDMRFKNQEATLDNVSIYEIIDNGLNITSQSEYCYLISNISELIDYKNELMTEFPVSSCKSKYKINFNKIINIAEVDKISYLRGHQRLVYWYNVTARKFGEFNINTVVRSNQYSDMESYKMIIVPKKDKPNLRVDLVIDKNEVNQYDTVDIKCYVTCIDDSKISTDWNISMSLEENDNGYLILESPSELNINIKKDQTEMKNWTIAYPNVGKYRIPGIKIDDTLYPSNDVIEVVSFYTMHYDFLIFYIYFYHF